MITIIGNRLNASNKKVLDRMNKKDYSFIRRETQMQMREGAEFIELNAVSLLHNEIPFLREAVPIIEECGAKVMVLSENIDALQEVLKLSKKEIIVGAIEYDRGKLDSIVELVKEKKAKLVALVKDRRDSNSASPEKSLLIAQQYIDYLLDHGMKRQDILLDPEIKPIEENFSNGRIFLDTLELFKLDFPQVKTMANIGVLSEGLPKRNLLNAYFLSLALSKGLDYVVTNVMDNSIVESIITTFTLIGKDRHLQGFLKFCRNHKEKTIIKGLKNGRPEDKRDFALKEHGV
jgi:5-methyltetrahydrofolate--homocysteine methyltransferase